uniref:Uncharacterized protein n=1 Tax=Trichogramma kaykai TaxID=54128 RepID=A0ABD2WF06_9HYME
MDAQEDVTASNTAEIADLRKVCNAVNDRQERGLEAIGSASTRAPVVDECEVLVTGISQAIQLSEEQILEKIVVALGLVRVSRFVAYTRPWIRRGPTGSGSSAPHTNKAFIFKLASAELHDILILKAPKLSKVNGLSLLGAGEETRIMLLGKAIATDHRNGYARPIVRNMTIYMRESKDSELTLAHKEEGLLVFKQKKN